MGTITKTYTEDWYTTNKSTWTFGLTCADQLVAPTNDEIEIVPPTMSVKYNSSVSKGYVNCFGCLAVDVDGLSKSTYSDANWNGFCYYHQTPETYDSGGYPVYLSLAQNVQYNVPHETVWYFNKPKIPVSNYFNSSNPNDRSIDLHAYVGYCSLASSSHKNMMNTDDESVTPASRHYNGIEIADSPAVNLGKLLTITLDAPPTVSLGTPTYTVPYAGLGAYRVPITTLQAKYGGNIVSAKLMIGADSTTQTYSASTVSNQTISVTPTNAGTYIPVVEVTDSRGQTKSVNLPQITVNAYTNPSVNFDIFRSNSSGVKDDEGTYGLITAHITYTDAAATLTAPAVTINGVTSSNITWYSNYSTLNGVSSAISNWTALVPTDHAITIYGLVNGPFDMEQSYVVGVTETDSQGGPSQTVTQTLSTAFYTVDYLAGGKEIAFGAPARIDDMYANISAATAPTFVVGSYYERSVDLQTGVIAYTALATEPSDWSTDWTDYYVLMFPAGMFYCAMSMEIEASTELAAAITARGWADDVLIN